MTLDEGAHLYGGYRHWTAKDFGVNPEHPPLVKLLAAAPLLGMHLQEPHPPRFYFLAEEYTGGDQLLAANGTDRLLGPARVSVSLLTFALGALVFAAGFEMFGPPVGLLALLLFTFEPTVLAHGALVTTDMGVACFLFAAVYSFYRYQQRRSIPRLLVCGLLTGLALSAKVSGFLALPVLLLLASVEVVQSPSDRWRRAGRNLWALLTIFAVSYAVLWSFYSFRYAARPDQLALAPSLHELGRSLAHPWQTRLFDFLAAWHLLPEAYLFGWAKLYSRATAIPGFFFGRLYPEGTWLYFPAALIIKSTLALLLLLAASPFVLRRSSREVLTLSLSILALLLACMSWHTNIGVRHALALYPFAILLGAAAAWSIARSSRVGAWAVATLLVFQCVSSLHAYPDYLPYSNEAFGGSSRTYRLLSDSNVDWAQQLKEVKTWLAVHHTGECWFAYSMFSKPLSEAEIPCKALPTGLALLAGIPQPVVPAHIVGTVLISAVDAAGPIWGPGDLNPYQQFQNGHPAELIGNSILVYRGGFDVPLASAQTHLSHIPALLRMHDTAAALGEAQTALSIAPEAPQLQAALGGVLLRLGRVHEAQQAFSRAMQQARAHRPDDESSQIAAEIAQLTAGHP